MPLTHAHPPLPLPLYRLQQLQQQGSWACGEAMQVEGDEWAAAAAGSWVAERMQQVQAQGAGGGSAFTSLLPTAVAAVAGLASGAWDPARGPWPALGLAHLVAGAGGHMLMMQ